MRRYQDPFDEYKTRLAAKLARRAAADDPDQAKKLIDSKKKGGDDMNWFGEKVKALTHVQHTALPRR